MMHAALPRATMHSIIHAAVTLACLAVTSAACKPVVSVENPSPFDEDDPAAAPEPHAAGSDARHAVPAADSPTRPRGLRLVTVERAALNAALDRGPGAFLRGIELKPRVHGGRFEGWEIVQLMPGETRFDALDLRPGDVIGAVNGHHLPRPEHLNALWTAMRSAESIVVAVRRGGEDFELRCEIIDAAGTVEPLGDTPAAPPVEPPPAEAPASKRHGS